MSLRALINGEPEVTGVDFRDRGLAYGDGLFETLAVRQGHPCLLGRHLRRLVSGCHRLEIPAPTEALLLSEIDLLLADRHQNGVLKIIITRGVGERGYTPDMSASATRILTFQDTAPRPSTAAAGLRVIRCATRLGCNPQLAGIKHLNRLEQVLAANEVAQAAADEGVVCDSLGRVIEGVSSNLYLITGSKITTPRLIDSGVHGIVRELVFEQAEKLDMQVVEQDLVSGDLIAADALLFSNSILGLRWSDSLDDHQYKGENRPVELLKKVNQAAFALAE